MRNRFLWLNVYFEGDFGHYVEYSGGCLGEIRLYTNSGSKK